MIMTYFIIGERKQKNSTQNFQARLLYQVHNYLVNN